MKKYDLIKMATDSNESAGIDGMSVKEIEEFKKENE